MILLTHNNRQIVNIDAISFADFEERHFLNRPIVSGILEIAERFPEETIGWVHEALVDSIVKDRWESLLHHPMELLSYEPSGQYYMSRDIEYIDFISCYVNRDVLGEVRFATWLSSTSMGVAYGVLIRRLSIYSQIENFALFLSYASFFGIKKGLFTLSLIHI